MNNNVYIPCGCDIRGAADEMFRHSEKLGEKVWAEFNGVKIYADITSENPIYNHPEGVAMQLQLGYNISLIKSLEMEVAQLKIDHQDSQNEVRALNILVDKLLEFFLPKAKDVKLENKEQGGCQ